MEQECRNIWLSSSEREMLVMAVRAIEQGVFQLRYDLFPLKPAASASLQTVERSCNRIRRILDVLELPEPRCASSERVSAKTG